MANQLGMAEQHSIIALRQRGWSYRRIARTLGIHRETVARYVLLASQRCQEAHGPPAADPKPVEPVNVEPADRTGLLGDSKPANAPAGSNEEADTCSESSASKPAISITGSDDEAIGWDRPKPSISITGSDDEAIGWDRPKPSISIAGSSSRQSLCEPYREAIEAYLEQGLTAQRIWQDLRAGHGFTDGYQSGQRFVRKLRSRTPLPFRRMECAPGEEAQVDFGSGAPVIQPDGKRKRPHLFRIVLSHSRKAYSEVVYRQTTESFLRCLENAFCHFGGVPRTLVVDNLKAAVLKADWYDPDLNPKIQAFAEHYGTVILPTRPRTPRHKGKVERQVGYAQSNALKGRTFTSLQAQNLHLLDWETQVADTRIHGTTRKQVGRIFQEVERPALAPLPPARFPSFQEAQRIVNRDAHVEVAKAFYSVPPEYLLRKVWVRWDTSSATRCGWHRRRFGVTLHLAYSFCPRGRFVFLVYNTKGTPLFYPVTIHNFGLYLGMRPMVTMRWFADFACLNNTDIGSKHRILLRYPRSAIITKTAQFELLSVVLASCTGTKASKYSCSCERLFSVTMRMSPSDDTITAKLILSATPDFGIRQCSTNANPALLFVPRDFPGFEGLQTTCCAYLLTCNSLFSVPLRQIAPSNWEA